ncbi:Cc8K15.2-like protein [Daphnia magna]|uniref:Cc8K15.2-like protein n=1 Tax=Daphnia magna TaxID=35525 RepID=A0A164D9V0_9CRUS|nr:Cc8K15.2-like protein [Daphnia magna]
MQLPVKYWNLMGDYHIIKQFVHQLEVVNDCAERGVKLISDFKDVCQNDQQKEFLFQVIEDHRKRVESFDKSNLNMV